VCRPCASSDRPDRPSSDRRSPRCAPLHAVHRVRPPSAARWPGRRVFKAPCCGCRSPCFFPSLATPRPPCLARRRRRAVPPVHSRGQAKPLALALPYP
jgi:hypothetical protein